MSSDLYITCPHCDCIFMVLPNEINCRIFRHFVFKDSFEQLNPHASESECNRVVQENLGYGCAKPIELIRDGKDNWIPVKCTYK